MEFNKRSLLGGWGVHSAAELGNRILYYTGLAIRIAVLVLSVPFIVLILILIGFWDWLFGFNRSGTP